jgi:hypothetical protein
MGVRLFTDKLVCWISEVPRGWLLDSATPSESAYLVHASGSPGLGCKAFCTGLEIFEDTMRESGNIIQAGIWGLTCAEPVDQIKGWCHCDGKK